MTIGAGLGASLGVGAQASWGGTLATITRWPTFKTAPMTWDPLSVQGGPYLRAGSIGDLGTARLTLLAANGSTSGPMAKGKITGDMQNTGMALLLACAMGSSATLSVIGATTAYELGGASLCLLGAPDVNNTFFDMQIGAPDDSGTVHAETYHSTVITAATWTFDRTGLVTWEYDTFSQFVEFSTSLTAVTEPGGPVPFAMQNSGCVFKVGTFGSEAATTGIKKATIKIERKLALDKDRLYLGNMTTSKPVSNNNIKLTVSLDMDYTSADKTALFDLFQAGTPTSIVVEAVGNAIGASGHSDTFGLNVTNAFVDTGGEPSVKGPAILGNTASWSGTVDATGDPQLTATLITADTSF